MILAWKTCHDFPEVSHVTERLITNLLDETHLRDIFAILHTKIVKKKKRASGGRLGTSCAHSGTSRCTSGIGCWRFLSWTSCLSSCPWNSMSNLVHKYAGKKRSYLLKYSCSEQTSLKQRPLHSSGRPPWAFQAASMLKTKQFSCSCCNSSTVHKAPPGRRNKVRFRWERDIWISWDFMF